MTVLNRVFPDRASLSSTGSDHLRVALIFVAMGLAHHLVADWGNLLGGDGWLKIYNVAHGSIAAAERPLALLFSAPVFWWFGSSEMAYFVAMQIVRIISAYLVYLTIREVAPTERILAFVVGLIYLTYRPLMWGFLESFNTISDHDGGVVTMLFALFLYARFLSKPTWFRLILACAAAVSSLLFRESAIALLFVTPVMMMLLQRDRSRIKLIGIALWMLIIIVMTLISLAPTLFSRGVVTYSNSTLLDLDIKRIMSGVRMQVGRELSFRVLTLQILHYRKYMLSIALQCLIAILGLLFLHTDDQPPVHTLSPSYRYLLGIGIGLTLFILGLVPYFPTIILNQIGRVSFTTTLGATLVYGSVILLISSLIRHTYLRVLVMFSLMFYIMAYGVTNIGLIQQDMYTYGFSWENSAYFIRSFAHLAPDLRENTLVIHMEDTELGPNPFDAGWGLQYAMRYLYDDRAVGLIPTDNLFRHVWEVSDSGVEIIAQPTARPNVESRSSSHGWDEIIFITKQPDGRVIILDEIPEDFYTPQRAELYDPYDRIVGGFIPATIQDILPPIQSPVLPDQ